ncbi:lipopolysaccharide biosynthesis protein [Arthrobacter sp. H14]|uniref:lipopolysaccharide biosynthesis protein n=1 Tax=Arthrobacter sp. H14 TaxID=1312959 RepID=UPI0004B86164|nr:oligosaccharide flippase family protein [Arthrobacter sp. H14]
MADRVGITDDAGTDSASGELRQAARGGVVSLVGAAISAGMGLIFIVVLGRSLGQDGAGVVLQAIAVFTIALALARVGMDTTGVWLLPRLRISAVDKIRSAVLFLLLPAAAAGVVFAGLVWFLAPLQVVSEDPYGRQLVECLRTLSWFLPCGAVLMVALQATRGLGGVLPYTVIGNIVLPTLRPVAVLVTVALGGSVVAVALSWAVPLVLALLGALAVLCAGVLRQERRAGLSGTLRPSRDVAARTWKFALPRWYSSVLEQSIIWFDVILVGAIAGAAAAGVYGAASRFVSAGLIISTAMRIVVSPRFSALLEKQRMSRVQELYTTTVTWIVLFGVPVYALFMLFAPTILGWLGDGFETGALALVILCAGASLSLLAGNADSLLMMSGRSGWMAANKTIVLTVNIGGNILLVPQWGILAAAAVWSFSMLLNAVLASIENRVFLGIRWKAGRVLYALLVALLSTVPGSLILLSILGNSTFTLVLATAVMLTSLILWCWMDRRRFKMDDLALLSRRGGGKSAKAAEPV